MSGGHSRKSWGLGAAGRRAILGAQGSELGHACGHVFVVRALHCVTLYSAVSGIFSMAGLWAAHARARRRAEELQGSGRYKHVCLVMTEKDYARQTDLFDAFFRRAAGLIYPGIGTLHPLQHHGMWDPRRTDRSTGQPSSPSVCAASRRPAPRAPAARRAALGGAPMCCRRGWRWWSTTGASRGAPLALHARASPLQHHILWIAKAACMQSCMHACMQSLLRRAWAAVCCRLSASFAAPCAGDSAARMRR